MVRLVRVVTDRNPLTLGRGGCQGENARRSKLALMDVGIEEDFTFNTESECHA